MRQTRTSSVRRDGWTPERQLRFLDALASTGNVSRAAGFAGMSRESAYRFRNRIGGSLFALMWDRALHAGAGTGEGHTGHLPDGRLARLLGNHFRRERGDFLRPGGAGGKRGRADRT